MIDISRLKESLEYQLINNFLPYRHSNGQQSGWYLPIVNLNSEDLR